MRVIVKSKNKEYPKIITCDKCDSLIENGTSFLRKHSKDSFWSASVGSLLIIIFRYENDEIYEIIITKDYYDSYIPFQTKDH